MSQKEELNPRQVHPKSSTVMMQGLFCGHGSAWPVSFPKAELSAYESALLEAPGSHFQEIPKQAKQDIISRRYLQGKGSEVT